MHIMRIVRNEEYKNKETYYEGLCPKYNKRARILISLKGRIESKQDLQPTFTPYFRECILLETENLKHYPCIECPIFEDFKNSHSY